jgi:four helix bundle protein
MKFKFEKLIVWQKAMDYGESIYGLTINFPKEETYNLVSQIRRAADSIALNIAEGAICQSNPELRKFLSYAIRSLAEVVTCLHKACRRKYITDKEFSDNYAYAFNLMNMMIAFRNKIN